MDARRLALARDGMAAWQRGDFDALESMFDPSVEYRWFEPGDWDCRDRTDVMRTLRERYAQGFQRGWVEIMDAGPDSIIVTTHPSETGGDEWPVQTATLITFRGDVAVRMQDYRTKEDALGAIAGAP